MTFDVMAHALAIHEHRCDLWRGPQYPGLARPFGRPDNMPPHRWHVSSDVMQMLRDSAAPPAAEVSDGAMLLLFDWPIFHDVEADAGTFVLEQYR